MALHRNRAGQLEVSVIRAGKSACIITGDIQWGNFGGLAD
jgi:hypothetical protein